MKLLDKPIFFIKELIDLSGWWVVIVGALGVFAGIGVGLIEIAFSLSLEQFLSSYNLVSRDEGFESWLPEIFDPLVLVLVIGVLMTGFRYLALLLPHTVLQLFLRRVRYLVSHETLSVSGEVSLLSVANCNNIMSVQAPGAADFLSAITTALISIIRLILLLGGIFVLSTELSLISIALISAFGLPTIIFRKLFVRLSRLFYKSAADYSENLVRSVRNVVFLKLSGQVQTERNKLDQYTSDAYKHVQRYNVVFYGNMVWPGLLSVFVAVLIVVINFEYQFQEESALIPFLYLLSRIASALSEFTGSYGKYQLCKPMTANLIKYNPILLRETKLANQETNKDILKPNKFVAKNLSIGRGEVLFEGIDILLKQGDVLLINGRSGSGKTTFLYTILGLIRPIEGQVLWNNVDIININQKMFSAHVSYSGSDPYLFDGTIEENIRLGTNTETYKYKDIQKAMKVSECGFIDQIEGNLAYFLKEGGEGISAGQKQRISLARALLKKPRVLFLDEATSNVDTETEKRIFSNMRDMYPEMMIISITHRDTTAEFATQVLNMDPPS